MVVIKWHRHACFEIRGSKVTVVTDPHDGVSLGISPPSCKGDIVLVSHNHFDHNAVDVVSKPDTEVVSAFIGEKEVKGVYIKGIKTYHDKYGGRQRGENTVYLFIVDGIRFVHLGDLGHTLEDQHLKELGEVDILFIPVGGTFTIGAKEAVEIVEKLKPRITIPMHYKIPGLGLPLSEVDKFTSRLKKIVEKPNEVSVTKEELPEPTEIWVLAPK
ncbi:MAG: Zn-dependent hydrolase [Thermoprotei archaeon]|nr:MAG: Zn-dependent hydrolase [Thermoprotei archaeon]RLE97664.1 MAG: Zn-dependent hydrolase [Thermoprotei archaeon]